MATTRRPWTQSEVERLIRLRKAGMSWAAVAAQLGRTPRACQVYAGKAGLTAADGPLAETYYQHGATRINRAVPQRMAPVERGGLTLGSVPPTRMHDRGEVWFAPESAPTVADYKARLLERAARRREARA